MDEMEIDMTSTLQRFWDDSWPIDVFNNLMDRHSEPHRVYHNTKHLENMFVDYVKYSHKLKYPKAVILGIFFHDSIYDPTRSDNEIESSLFMSDVMENHVDESIIDIADDLIISTWKHSLPKERHFHNDIRYFLDMDLAILSSLEDDFWAYEAAIRNEYSFVPLDVYRAKRAEIMQLFLERKKIYYTDMHSNEDAKRNLSMLISSLTSKA